MIRKIFGRWGMVWGLALGGLLLAGCQSEETQFTDLPGYGVTPGGAGTAAAPPAGGEQLRIGKGFALKVTFSDMPIPYQPMDVTVREDGKITLLQNHDFVAEGKTRGALAQEIHAFYVPNYYPTMTATVDFQRDGQFYYVGGEVKMPNRFVYLGPIHLLAAIRSAGDFSDFANKRSVILVRADGRKVTINCKKALDNPALDPEIYPGDNIHVPRRGPLW
jgi:protein involved in polysaccharide export with SLBB domain